MEKPIQNPYKNMSLKTSGQTDPFFDPAQGGTPSPLITSEKIKSFSAASSNNARKNVKTIIDTVNAQDTNLPETKQPDQRTKISDALDNLLAEDGNAFSDFQDSLKAFEKGAVNLSQDEKKLLGGLQERYDILKRRQMVANQSLEGGMKASQNTSGTARYAPEMADIEINRVQNEGIDRLRELDIELDTKLQETRDAIIKGRIDGITASYKAYQDRLKERRDTLNLMRQNLNDYESYTNSQSTADMKEYKFAQDQGFSGTFQQWKNQKKF